MRECEKGRKRKRKRKGERWREREGGRVEREGGKRKRAGRERGGEGGREGECERVCMAITLNNTMSCVLIALAMKFSFVKLK